MVQLQNAMEAKDMKADAQPDMTRRAFLAGGMALVGAAGASLAGCTSGGGSAASTAGASGSQASPAASESSAADNAPANVLTAACAHASANFNPIGGCGGTSLGMAATRHVLEGLYDLDMRTFQPYEALADGEPRKLSDVEYEVTLREGARFSDGVEVTVADVVNTFEKNLANQTLGPLLGFIAAVEARGERTVAFLLNEPMEDLLQARLSLVKVFPAAHEAELNTLPIGSGPWAYVPGELDGTRRIAFAPNEHYNGPLPAEADGMTWTVMAESADARVTALRDRAVQVAEDIPSWSIDEVKRSGAFARFSQGFNQAFFMFNTLRKPFSDKRVRQALFYAVNVEKLVNDKLDGRAAPLTGFLPEGHANYHRASTVYEHNPDKARALLALALQPNLEFTLIVNNNWVADLAQQIADDLAACGITCRLKVEAIRWNEFGATDQVLPYDAVLAAGDPSCFGNDPDLLMSWWYGDTIWTQARSCWARDPNGSFAEMQALLHAARATAGEERQELWNRCFDIIAEEVPLYGLFHRQIATGWQMEDIAGFSPTSTAGLDLLGCSVWGK